MSIIFLLFLKSCVRYIVKNRTKIKLSESSSRHFDDSVAAVHVFHSDKSAQYFTFFTGGKSGIAC